MSRPSSGLPCRATRSGAHSLVYPGDVVQGCAPHDGLHILTKTPPTEGFLFVTLPQSRPLRPRTRIATARAEPQLDGPQPPTTPRPLTGQVRRSHGLLCGCGLYPIAVQDWRRCGRCCAALSRRARNYSRQMAGPLTSESEPSEGPLEWSLWAAELHIKNPFSLRRSVRLVTTF